MKKFVLMVILFATVAIFSFAANAVDTPDYIVPDYIVQEGTIYWESAWGGGSGKHGKISKENNYAGFDGKEFHVFIDGYSFLDEHGRIISKLFDEKNFALDIPNIEGKKMLHIWSASGYRLGWIDASSIIHADNEEQHLDDEDEINNTWFQDHEDKSVEEVSDIIQEEIRKDEEIPRESIILADLSGSMYDFQEEVLSKVQQNAGQKIVFAETFCEYERMAENDIGGLTDIAAVLNNFVEEGNSHIYVLSDLCDNCGTHVWQNERFIGEITIVFYPNDISLAGEFFEKIKRAYPKAKITGF